MALFRWTGSPISFDTIRLVLAISFRLRSV